MPILQTIDLKKYYGVKPNITKALDGISLSVEAGEFVAIVGTSGSGKSTLLNMIGGLDVPTSGKVIVDGKDLSKLKDEQLTIFRRRKIGFVFQNYNLVPVLNVYENIALPVELDGDKVDKKFMLEVVKMLALEDKLGVNGAYTTSTVSISGVIPVLAAILVIFIAGYLLIYNVFYISIAQDIRFYGMLKTLGTTARQIRKIVYKKAIRLSVIGIPLGLLLGWPIGRVLIPSIVRMLSGNMAVITTINPIIFFVAVLFALITVRQVRLRPLQAGGGGAVFRLR